LDINQYGSNVHPPKKRKEKESSKKKILLSPNYLQRQQAHRLHAKIKNAVEMINYSNFSCSSHD
jgi:Tfp pilus assembly protein PilF